MEIKDIISLSLLAIAFLGLRGGIINRMVLRKGIGNQFVRYAAIVVALPIAGALAAQGLLTEAAVTAILGILGYVFARGNGNNG